MEILYDGAEFDVDIGKRHTESENRPDVLLEENPNSDYHNHKDVPPAAARQAEVARDYLKRAARIDKLNGHQPGSDGPMATALKRYNGSRVLVFVVGEFAEMPEDVSRIYDIIAHGPAQVREIKSTFCVFRFFLNRVTSVLKSEKRIPG